MERKMIKKIEKEINRYAMKEWEDFSYIVSADGMMKNTIQAMVTMDMCQFLLAQLVLLLHQLKNYLNSLIMTRNSSELLKIPWSATVR